MKKIFHLGIVLAFLLALVPVSTIAHYEDDPLVVDLLAGQTEDIGDVKVWNDADNLYVQFVYTGDDCGFLEVHLQVDEDAFDDDIMTKKGNPIPGKFEKSYDVGCFTQHTFAYDLASEGFVPGDFLLIAAHAALGLEEFLVIVSDTFTQTAGWFERDSYTGDVDAAYALNASNYSEGGSWVNSADITTPNSAWYMENLLADAIWISSIDGLEGSSSYDQWRLFTEEFDIPEWASDIVGSIQFTADNAVAAYLNGFEIAKTTYVYDIATAPPRDISVQHFRNLYGPYDILPIAGSNTLSFVVRNYYGTGDNPSGLLYRAEITYYTDGETAWGSGFDFPGANWATYFNYTVQGCSLDPGLVNGSFETPVVPDGYGWYIFDDGTTGMGWTVEWAEAYAGAPSIAKLEFHRDVNGWMHKDDSQHVELDTDWDLPGVNPGNQDPASVEISQELQTCAGYDYQVSFSYSPRPGHADNILKVYWDGDLVGTYIVDGSSNTNTVWTDIDLTLSASGPTTELAFVEAGTPDSRGMFLDAVSVSLCNGSCSP